MGHSVAIFKILQARSRHSVHVLVCPILQEITLLSQELSVCIALVASPDHTCVFCNSASIQPRNWTQVTSFTISVHLLKCFSPGILFSLRPKHHSSPSPNLSLHRLGRGGYWLMCPLGSPAGIFWQLDFQIVLSWENICLHLLPSIGSSTDLTTSG